MIYEIIRNKRNTNNINGWDYLEEKDGWDSSMRWGGSMAFFRKVI